MKRLLAALFLAAPLAVSATPITLTGSFIASGAYDPNQISGTWQLTYDDATIGPGIDAASGALESLTFSPDPLGVTTFDTSNTNWVVSFLDGAVRSVRLGGAINGVVSTSSVQVGTDDFGVEYSSDGSLLEARWTVASRSDEASVTASEGSWQRASTPPPTVSEPGMLGLLALGLLAMASRGRRFNLRGRVAT